MSRPVAEFPSSADWVSDAPYVNSAEMNVARGRIDTGSAASSLLIYVEVQLHDAARHFVEPVSRQSVSIEDRFRELADEWRAGIGPTSSITKMAMHPAYQAIIGLGWPVVPLIIRELREMPDHWFWALEAITQVDPVAPDDRGNLRAMTNAWLKWAHDTDVQF